MSITEQDQAAIYHVASVSKHPHAAMIVKWLINGWEVRRKSPEGWNEERFPQWLPGCEYELIEPKTAKPAYRVYIDKEGIPFIAHRYENGEIAQTYKEYEYLTDWKEYDPPKKWPTPLVERIAAIDIKAAEWIVDNWDDLLDAKYVTKDNYSRDSEILISMFCWKASPQGSQYWNSIDNKLP